MMRDFKQNYQTDNYENLLA